MLKFSSFLWLFLLFFFLILCFSLHRPPSVLKRSTFLLSSFPPSVAPPLTPSPSENNTFCLLSVSSITLCCYMSQASPPSFPSVLSLKLAAGRVISLPIGFRCRLNCVFVPINLIKGLIAFANQPVSSCCCLLLPLISEITGPLLEHKAPDNNTESVGGWVGGVPQCLWFWTDTNFPPKIEEVNVFLYLWSSHLPTLNRFIIMHFGKL